MRQFVYVAAIVMSLMAGPLVAANVPKPAIAPANSAPNVLSADAWQLGAQGAKASQAPDDGGVRLDVTALSDAPARSDAQWFYQGASAKAGKYILRFSAKASSARQVSLAGTDSGAAAPFLGPVAIELKESWQTYQCAMTLPRDLGADTRFPCFQFGDQAGAVWIRDVKLVQEKKLVSLIPDMQNPATWLFRARETAAGTMRSENQTIRVDVTRVTTEAWHVLMSHAGPNLPVGKSYVFRFSARSSVPTKIQTVGKQGDEPFDDLAEPGSFDLTTQWKDYAWRFKLDKPSNANANLPVLNLGANKATIWLRDMSFAQE